MIEKYSRNSNFLLYTARRSFPRKHPVLY